MTTTIEVTADQTLLIESCNWNPDAALLKLCETESQREHWQRLQDRYQRLGVELDKYFTGRGSDYNPTTEAGEYWQRRVRRWVLLYDVLQGAWPALETPLKTPGEYVRLLLKLEAVSLFWECLPETPQAASGFSPSNYQKLKSATAKAQQYIAQKKAVPKSVRKKIHDAEAALSESMECEPFSNFYCLWFDTLSKLEAIAKKSSLTRERLRALLENEAMILTTAERMAHPREKFVAPYKWINGQKMTS